MFPTWVSVLPPTLYLYIMWIIYHFIKNWRRTCRGGRVMVCPGWVESALYQDLITTLAVTFAPYPYWLIEQILCDFNLSLCSMFGAARAIDFLNRHVLLTKWKWVLTSHIIMLYYQATQVAQFSTVYSQGEKPEWLAMEQTAVNQLPLDWQPGKSRPPILAPTLSHSIVIWDRVRSNTNLISSFHLLAHLFNNSAFPLPG